MRNRIPRAILVALLGLIALLRRRARAGSTGDPAVGLRPGSSA